MVGRHQIFTVAWYYVNKMYSEVVVTVLAPSPLAAQIGIGRRVRCPSKNRENLTLDKWGFALLVGQEPRGSTDS